MTLPSCPECLFVVLLCPEILWVFNEPTNTQTVLTFPGTRYVRVRVVGIWVLLHTHTTSTFVSYVLRYLAKSQVGAVFCVLRSRIQLSVTYCTRYGVTPNYTCDCCCCFAATAAACCCCMLLLPLLVFWCSINYLCSSAPGAGAALYWCFSTRLRAAGTLISLASPPKGNYFVIVTEL